jgi:AbrB family looped-hinge helix DNA binding protein
MRVAIDAVGRIVIPKPRREELGIASPTHVELRAADGRLEVTVPDVPARVEERDGLPVIAPDTSVVVAALAPWHAAHGVARAALVAATRRLGRPPSPRNRR